MVRMLCVMLCGRIIGIEREYKRRSAGFRTHILMCMGAAMITLTSLICIFAWVTILTWPDKRTGCCWRRFYWRWYYYCNETAACQRIDNSSWIVDSSNYWPYTRCRFFKGGLFVIFLILVAEMLFVKLEYKLLNNTRERF